MFKFLLITFILFANIAYSLAVHFAILGCMLNQHKHYNKEYVEITRDDVDSDWERVSSKHICSDTHGCTVTLTYSVSRTDQWAISSDLTLGAASDFLIKTISAKVGVTHTKSETHSSSGAYNCQAGPGQTVYLNRRDIAVISYGWYYYNEGECNTHLPLKKEWIGRRIHKTLPDGELDGEFQCVTYGGNVSDIEKKGCRGKEDRFQEYCRTNGAAGYCPESVCSSV